MNHQHSADGPDSCFGCKIRSLQFGVVPGGYRASNSQSYYDKDSLPDFPEKEEVMDNRAAVRNAPVKEMKLEDLAKH